MKNSIGNSVIFTLFGESHGEAIGAVLDGFAPGIKVDFSIIEKNLAKRRPNGKTDTARIEKDNLKFISGIYNGYTTGSPICVIINNENKDSSAYNDLKGIARPSHADFTAHLKYHGFEDFRGGGHFSGRITTPIVAIGSICLQALKNIGINVGTHILKCGEVSDKSFENYFEEIDIIDSKIFPVINDVEKKMEDEIFLARENQDSIGGITQTGIVGLPAGLGEPWFSSVEGVLANAMFSIGGVKGIEFGLGFDFSKFRGSEVNDGFRIKNKNYITRSNNNGGINGGITNGMPIVFNCAVKPTPSISRKQETINFIEKKETEIEIKGRHDPAIIRRICIVMTSLTSIVLCDMISQRYGVDILAGDKPLCNTAL